MKTLIDVANFNADASCLEGDVWLSWLENGDNSSFVKWLNLYVTYQKPIVLALTGATAADLAYNNPEAISLINDNPNIFQIIARPFAHDAALLRSRKGFVANFLLGKEVLESLFGNIFPAFLPPEFMLTAEQSYYLAVNGIQFTFINGDRFQPAMRSRISKHPYRLKCPLQKDMVCIPFDGDLTISYLDSLDRGNADLWNSTIGAVIQENLYLWRDAETVTLFHEGIKREERWLQQESGVFRKLLDAKIIQEQKQNLSSNHVQTYPLHSLLPWIGESRMFSYIQKLNKMEYGVKNMDLTSIGLWLYAITSDVLSAVEKAPVPKFFEPLLPHEKPIEATLMRSDRGYEGAECLMMLERYIEDGSGVLLQTSDEVWAKKVRGRCIILDKILSEKKLKTLLNYSVADF